jgi:4-amino-4-deoxy-L-arabinose transferase-like glycosyltransferase
MRIKQNSENFSKLLFEKFKVIKTLIPGSVPVYLAVLIAGLTARIILFMNWMESPFRYYHTISGLDMKTIMGTAEQFCHGKTDFSIYKFFVYCCYLLSGHDLNVTVIILGQFAIGIATSLLITFITLKILKNRPAALISGICAALYSQELMYESVILIESVYLFTCTLSLAAILHHNRRPGSKTWPVLSGFAAALPSLVRFPGILWTFLAVAWIIYTQLNRDRKHRNTANAKLATLLPIGGLLIAFIPVSIFNFRIMSNFTPIPAIPSSVYAVKAGLETNLTNHSLPVESIGGRNFSYLDKAENYAGKFFSIFSAYEIPDNLNYYFVREMLPPLKYMPGPLLLIPFATLGMIIVLLNLRPKLRETFLLFIYFFAFAIPMTVYVPLGRYKLVFLPVFCVFAAFAITFIISIFFQKKKNYPMLLALAAVYALLFVAESPTAIERAEDFVAYGTAMEAAGKYDSREIEASYRIAYQLNPTVSAAIHLANLLMKNSGFADPKTRQAAYAEAENILRGFYESNRNSQSISINYAAALLGTGKPEDAEKVLLGISEPENRRSKVNYYYQLGESRRLQGKKNEALACYQLSLDNADTAEQKKIIQRTIDNNVKN